MLYNLNCYHALITPHIITEQCGTKQNLPLKMVPVNPLAHGLIRAFQFINRC